jgi:hypothetical protein
VTVSAWQIQLPTGTVVGAGTNVNIVSITGLRDLGGLRTSDQPRAQSDGTYPGLNQLGERAVQIVWDVTLATGGVESALQTLAAAYQNIADPGSVCMTAGDYLRQQASVGTNKPVSMLQIQLPNRTYPFYLFGRPTKYNPPIDLNYQYGKIQIATEWSSADGVIYDGHVVSASAGLPSPTSGMSWPASFPWTFGSSSGGSFSLNNTGAYPAKPFFVINGPISYPVLTNTNTGAFMALDIPLASGDVLTVDHQAGVVTYNGANRNNVVRVGSSFFTCAPGNSTIQITSGDSVTVTGTATGYLLPTYSAV